MGIPPCQKRMIDRFPVPMPLILKVFGFRVKGKTQASVIEGLMVYGNARLGHGVSRLRYLGSCRVLGANNKNTTSPNM